MIRPWSTDRRTVWHSAGVNLHPKLKREGEVIVCRVCAPISCGGVTLAMSASTARGFTVLRRFSTHCNEVACSLPEHSHTTAHDLILQCKRGLRNRLDAATVLIDEVIRSLFEVRQ
jgi:hypothetical protein